MPSDISVCFSGRVNLKQIEEKTALGGLGPGGMLSQKNFEMLHNVMAFLVLFEQILIKLFDPHLKSFTKYDAFCRTFSIYACLLQATSGSRKF